MKMQLAAFYIPTFAGNKIVRSTAIKAVTGRVSFAILIIKKQLKLNLKSFKKHNKAFRMHGQVRRCDKASFLILMSAILRRGYGVWSSENFRELSALLNPV